jgi:hypothetical protein
MLAASSVWPHVVSAENYWNDQQQEEYTESMRHAHELEMRQHSGKRRSADAKSEQEQELAAAQAHWQQQLNNLEQAQARSQRPGRICFWLGLLATASGLLVYRYAGN